MGILLAFAVGYAVGARAGSEDFEDVMRSISSIKNSEEFRDFVVVLRSHVGHALREVADLVDGAPEAATTKDLVDRVKTLIGRN